jgi:hypothetical protein
MAGLAGLAGLADFLPRLGQLQNPWFPARVGVQLLQDLERVLRTWAEQSRHILKLRFKNFLSS